MLRVIAKGIGFFSRSFSFIFIASLGRFFIRSPQRRRVFSIHTASFIHESAIEALGVRLSVRDAPARSSTKKPFFVVANHVSDLDPLILNSILPMVFVTSMEVYRTPFLGTCARLAESVFVERRNKFGLSRELAALRQVFDEGFDVALFPEGTSSNGDGVLPFRSALFQAAIDAEAVLLPVCLNYRTIDNEQLNENNRDRVFYYGDMTFPGHLRKLLAVRSMDVECRFLAPMPLVKNDNRLEISQRARQLIFDQYIPVHHAPKHAVIRPSVACTI